MNSHPLVVMISPSSLIRLQLLRMLYICQPGFGSRWRLNGAGKNIELLVILGAFLLTDEGTWTEGSWTAGDPPPEPPNDEKKDHTKDVDGYFTWSAYVPDANGCTQTATATLVDPVCDGTPGTLPDPDTDTKNLDPLPPSCNTCDSDPNWDAFLASEMAGYTYTPEGYGPEWKCIEAENSPANGWGYLQAWIFDCDGDPDTEDEAYWQVDNAVNGGNEYDTSATHWIYQTVFWGAWPTESQLPKGATTGDTAEIAYSWNPNIPGEGFFGNAQDTGTYATVCKACFGSWPKTIEMANTGECCWFDYGTDWVVCPVIVDLTGLGYPALLAGPQAWRQARPFVSQDTLPSTDASRVFEMIPGEQGLWEWVGPEAGVLVSGKPGVLPESKLTGADLFGQFTWGKRWENGYKPLATLDTDGNGRLEGPELLTVYVWQDLNGDALADAGEMRPASEVFDWLSVSPADDGVDAWSEQGAQLKAGKVVPSWDWWSRSFKTPSFGGLVPSLVKPDVGASAGATVYLWREVETPEGRPILGGFLRFVENDGLLSVAISGPDFGTTRLMNLAPVKVGKPDSKGWRPLTWSISRPGYSLTTKVWLSPEGELRGQSVYSQGTFPAQVWQAFPLGDRRLDAEGASVAAFSNEAFDVAISQGRPDGMLTVPQGPSTPQPPISLETLLLGLK